MLQNMSACQNKATKQHNLMFPPATRTSTISKATVCSGRNKSKKKQPHNFTFSNGFCAKILQHLAASEGCAPKNPSKPPTMPGGSETTCQTWKLTFHQTVLIYNLYLYVYLISTHASYILDNSMVQWCLKVGCYRQTLYVLSPRCHRAS